MERNVHKDHPLTTTPVKRQASVGGFTPNSIGEIASSELKSQRRFSLVSSNGRKAEATENVPPIPPIPQVFRNHSQTKNTKAPCELDVPTTPPDRIIVDPPTPSAPKIKRYKSVDVVPVPFPKFDTKEAKVVSEELGFPFKVERTEYEAPDDIVNGLSTLIKFPINPEKATEKSDRMAIEKAEESNENKVRKSFTASQRDGLYEMTDEKPKAVEYEDIVGNSSVATRLAKRMASVWKGNRTPRREFIQQSAGRAWRSLKNRIGSEQKPGFKELQELVSELPVELRQRKSASPDEKRLSSCLKGRNEYSNRTRDATSPSSIGKVRFSLGNRTVGTLTSASDGSEHQSAIAQEQSESESAGQKSSLNSTIYAEAEGSGVLFGLIGGSRKVQSGRWRQEENKRMYWQEQGQTQLGQEYHKRKKKAQEASNRLFQTGGTTISPHASSGIRITTSSEKAPSLFPKSFRNYPPLQPRLLQFSDRNFVSSETQLAQILLSYSEPSPTPSSLRSLIDGILQDPEPVEVSNMPPLFKETSDLPYACVRYTITREIPLEDLIHPHKLNALVLEASKVFPIQDDLQAQSVVDKIKKVTDNFRNAHNLNKYEYERPHELDGEWWSIPSEVTVPQHIIENDLSKKPPTYLEIYTHKDAVKAIIGDRIPNINYPDPRGNLEAPKFTWTSPLEPVMTIRAGFTVFSHFLDADKKLVEPFKKTITHKLKEGGSEFCHYAFDRYWTVNGELLDPPLPAPAGVVDQLERPRQNPKPSLNNYHLYVPTGVDDVQRILNTAHAIVKCLRDCLNAMQETRARLRKDVADKKKLLEEVIENLVAVHDSQLGEPNYKCEGFPTFQDPPGRYYEINLEERHARSMAILRGYAICICSGLCSEEDGQRLGHWAAFELLELEKGKSSSAAEILSLAPELQGIERPAKYAPNSERLEFDFEPVRNEYDRAKNIPESECKRLDRIRDLINRQVSDANKAWEKLSRSIAPTIRDCQWCLNEARRLDFLMARYAECWVKKVGAVQL